MSPSRRVRTHFAGQTHQYAKMLHKSPPATARRSFRLALGAASFGGSGATPIFSANFELWSNSRSQPVPTPRFLLIMVRSRSEALPESMEESSLSGREWVRLLAKDNVMHPLIAPCLLLLLCASFSALTFLVRQTPPTGFSFISRTAECQIARPFIKEMRAPVEWAAPGTDPRF